MGGGRRPKPKPNLGQYSRLLGSAYPPVRRGGGDAVERAKVRGKVKREKKKEGKGGGGEGGGA